MNSITRNLLIAAANKRHFAVSFIGCNNKYLKITDNNTGKSDIFYGSRPLASSKNGSTITTDKADTMDFIMTLGFKVFPYQVYADMPSAIDFMNKQGSIVVKPIDGQKSIGVTVGITKQVDLENAIRFAKHNSPSNGVILQKELQGNLYRIFILNGKYIAASHRRAPYIIGDGVHTVEELIIITNNSPNRGDTADAVQGYISLADAKNYLGIERFQTVLAKGESVRCLAIESVSTGGDAFNVTNQVHESLIAILEKIAKELQLFTAGFELIIDDIAQPIHAVDPLPILEINSCPGLKIHHYPTGGGDPIDVAGLILDELFKQ